MLSFVCSNDLVDRTFRMRNRNIEMDLEDLGVNQIIIDRFP
jgi:hypothetical protein